MSLADNIAQQFIESISRFTPDYVEKIAQAKADGLRITEPEQRARDEYNVKIAEHDAKLKALKDAEAKDADTKKQIIVAKQELEAGQQALKRAKDDHAKALQSINDRDADLSGREQALALEKKQVEQVCKANESETKRLKDWADSLAEQADSFDQAQKLIKRK